MSRESWTHKLSFNLSRETGWRPALSLAFGLLLVAGEPLSRVSAQAQDQKRLAAEKKYEEGAALLKRETVESRRLAAQKFEEALTLYQAIGDRNGEATTLINIGLAYNSLGEKRKAIDFFNQVLPVLRALGDHKSEALALIKIGNIYGSLGEKRKAIGFFNQALPPFRAAGDRREEAQTLSDIGLVYYSLSENQKALGFFNQALALHRAIGDRNGEATTLEYIGAIEKILGRNQKAAQSQERLAAQRKYEEGDALLKQGTEKSLRLALKKYEEALPLWRADGVREGEAATLTVIGFIYRSLGANRKALDHYNQALPLQRAAGDQLGRLGEATTLNAIGEILNYLGDWRKALESFNQALAIHRTAGERRGEAATLSIIGLVYKLQGEKRQALDYCNQALAIHRAISDRGGEAKALTIIGGVYFQSAESQMSLDLYAQALAIYRAVSDREGEATTLREIGSVFYSLGEWRKALDHFNQALSADRSIGDRRGEATTLNKIGDVNYSLGESEKAIASYNQALAIYRAIGDHREEGATLTNIGALYESQREYLKALDFFTQSAKLQQEKGYGDGAEVARRLTKLSSVLISLRMNEQALRFCNLALPIHRRARSLDGEVATLKNIAHAEWNLGHFDESRSHMEAALKIIESIRARVDSRELRASYFARVQDHYEFYVDMLMRMHGREPAKGHDAAALEASERGRARSLLDSLAESRANIRRGADPSLLEQERLLQQSLNAKAEVALELSASGESETQLASIRREMDALTVELQQVQAQIRQSSPRYAALTQPQPLTLAKIQRQVLDADELLLEYSLGKERGYLWAVTPTTINSYELPKREEIEAAANLVYELLSKSRGARGQAAKPGVSGSKEAGEEYLAAATSLSRMLLGPVAGQLGKKRLLIVADGMLHYVPFGALPDPNSLKESDPSWRPLLVEHEVVNLPSASTIAVLRRELAGRKPAAKTLAVLADPVFSRDDERIRPGASLAAQPAAQRDPLDESRARILVEIAGGAPNDLRELRIKRLPFTRMEAEAITALVPAGAGIKALDFDASRATATSERLGQYRYLHFATHGLADSERPELSTIVLSLYDKQGRPQDGFLRAHEVYNLELPAELVTLSACETGLGKLTKGEGLVSLTRGFMYAGAARVVVSLWSVSDRATAELMTKFYRSVLVEGERPAAALRAAQVEMWRDKRWKAPYYWAAFTLQGEWR